MSTYELIMLVITGIGALGCFLFAILYWVKSRGAWWNAEAGRFLMFGYANLGALFLLVIVNQIFETWTGQRPVTVLLFASYVVQAWWPLRLLIKEQRRAERGMP